MQFLGVQIDRPHLRAALVNKRGKKLEVFAMEEATLNEPENVKRLYKAGFKGKIGTGVLSKELLVRALELKVAGGKHVEEMVAFQAEATSHFDPAAILNVSRVKKDEALVFTINREAIRSLLTQVEKLGIDPDGISSVPTALCSFVKWKLPELEHAFIIDLGSSEWTCVWMENGELKRSYAIATGIESLLAALWEDRKKILLQKEIEGAAKQINLLLLQPNNNPHLTVKLSEMRLSLAKAIYSFRQKSEKIPVIFTGRLDAFCHLREFLLEGFQEAVSEAKGELTSDEQKFAVAIGLALERIEPKGLQFRRGEFFSSKNWKRAGFYALTVLLASFGLTAGLIYFGMTGLQKRKVELFKAVQASLDLWDPSFKKKMIQEGNSEEEMLEQWVSAVESNKKEYALIPRAPKVAEVLSWLSVHPLLEGLKKEGDPLQISEMRYQLQQFPKIGSAGEPYLAKVEIEFRVKEARNARKFHEALLQGDDLVNGTQEVTWEALNDSYRTSFFLKNRSRYVP